MTRKEEIRQAAESFDIKIISNPWTLFEKGAEWADAHPKPITYEAIENVAKEVIDEDPQLDKLWDMIENDLRDKFIDKACEWLDCYIDNYLFIDAENKAGIKWDDFINDFRKAMKGGEE